MKRWRKCIFAFADYTILSGIVNILEKNKIQNVLGNLGKWTENNKVKFNEDNHKVFYLGNENQRKKCRNV